MKSPSYRSWYCVTTRAISVAVSSMRILVRMKIVRSVPASIIRMMNGATSANSIAATSAPRPDRPVSSTGMAH